jgi:hypothetical protein
MNELTYQRPKLYPKQREFIDCKARYTIVEASPKTGKTVGCMLWLIELALAGKPGYNYWWVAPTLNVAGIAFRRMQIWLKTSGIPQSAYRVNLSSGSIQFAHGTQIWFKGSDKPDTLYGEDVYAAVMDEATRCKTESWPAVRSTLTATGGHVKIIGNIRGRRNWAYKLARKAQAGEPNMAYFALTAYDAVEGGIYDVAEIEDARSVLADAIFRELYLLEPSDDQGNPFGFNFINAAYTEEFSEDTTSVFGVDLARGGKLNKETGLGVGDWTVVLGMNQQGHPTSMDRWQAPWDIAEDRILDIVGNTESLIDSTGVGEGIVAHLQQYHGNIEGFVFTSPSKQQLIELLVKDLQQGRVRIVGEIAKNEFESFEYEYTRTGVVYAAACGDNDDVVCAYALANRILRSHIPFALGKGETRNAAEVGNRFTPSGSTQRRNTLSRF